MTAVEQASAFRTAGGEYDSGKSQGVSVGKPRGFQEKADGFCVKSRRELREKPPGIVDSKAET